MGIETYNTELNRLYQETLKNATNKEAELLRLLRVKAEKMANDYLMKQEHTQLSYLPKDIQEKRIALPKGIILDKLIGFLRSI